MTFNLEKKIISPNFHAVHDDNFHTVVSNANIIPPNWCEIFDVNHYADHEEFTVPFQAYVLGNSNKSAKFSLKLNDTADSNNVNGNDKEEVMSSVPKVANSNNNNVNDKEEVASSVPRVSEIASLPTVSEGALNSKGRGSFARTKTTKLGRISVTPENFLKAAFIGFLSSQAYS